MSEKIIPALIDPIALFNGFTRLQLATPDERRHLQPIQLGSDNSYVARVPVSNHDGITVECVALTIDLHHGAAITLLMSDYHATTVMVALGKAIDTTLINGHLVGTISTTQEEIKQ
jgi:hypothetical protein